MGNHSIKVYKLGSILMALTILVLVLAGCKGKRTDQQKSSLSADSCQLHSNNKSIIAKEDGMFKAYRTTTPVVIDGCNRDSIWTLLNGYDMNYKWMGEVADSTDYHGQFKLAWDSRYLYVLVEVTDDYLNPTLKNGIENYWKGDYVEVFIDEDASGGNHQFSHQAFAYHVSTEGHAIDLNTAKEPIFFDDHIKVEHSQEGNRHLWEMAITLFDKDFDENSTNNSPVKIFAQKRIGFSIAYGDNDGNNSRENFMGSKKLME